MTQRNARGQFIKGASGNPKGRPAKAEELRRHLEGDAQQVADKVLEAARNGDMQACRLVLERCVPAIKPASACVTFDLDPAQPLTDQARQVLSAIAQGALPPDQGKALLDGIAALVRVAEADELTRRLEAIEAVSREGKE